MKRHVAGTLLGVLVFFIIDNHIDWVKQDNGTLLEVNGQQFDVQGWLAEHWRQLHSDCHVVPTKANSGPTASAVLQAIQQHSLPDSRQARLLQLQHQGDWAIAEVAFKTLNPSLVVLRQTQGNWRVQDSAVWSGSTSPWWPADFVRRYWRQQAPELPQALRDCVPIDARRYTATASGARP